MVIFKTVEDIEPAAYDYDGYVCSDTFWEKVNLEILSRAYVKGKTNTVLLYVYCIILQISEFISQKKKQKKL